MARLARTIIPGLPHHVTEYDGANALQARFTHGQRIDQPLAIERGATLAYVQADHLGSVRQVTDAAGTVINSYDYDAYGNFEAQSETLAQSYAFTGREFDPESGLLYYRARYYVPATGRFLSEDPIGLASGDANAYRYVFNSPAYLIDPFGLAAATQSVALTALVAAGQVTVESLIGALIACLVVQAVDAIDEAIGSNFIEGGLCASPSRGTILASSPPGDGGEPSSKSGSSSAGAPGDPNDCKPGPRAKFTLKAIRTIAGAIFNATLTLFPQLGAREDASPIPENKIEMVKERKKRGECGPDNRP